MSLCINPRCLQPDHPGNDGSQFCQSCGSDLLLLNRYRVMRLLSDKSGFGRVFEAFDRTTPKILKVLKSNFSQNAKAVALFQQEAMVLSQLPHPGIPAIEPQSYFQFYPRNSAEPLHCIVMEKIDGPNLREWMRQQGDNPISEKQAFNWLKQLSEVLHLVHQKNYFHRDIKPENIMLRSNGQLVLVDFGAAREMTYTYLAQLGKSGEITRISSAGYTPPEQEKGQAVPQSDFYALGCTFIYLLTGKSPTDSRIYDSLSNEFHWRPYAPQVSSPLASYIDKLVAPRASDRPKSTQEMLVTLPQLEAASQVPPPTRIGSQSLSQSLSQGVSQPPHTVVQGTSGTRQAGRTGGAEVSQSEVGKSIHSSSKRWLWGGAIALLALLGGGYAWQNYYNPSVQTIKQLAPLRTLQGHTSFVNALAISPDGKILVSGSADQTIKVWDWATGTELRTLAGHTSFVNALAIARDGKTLVSGSADQTIKIWDLTTGKELRTLAGHAGFVNALNISHDGRILVSGSADQTIKVWDLPTGKELRTLAGHTGFINSLNISADGYTLVSGGTDQTLKVWDLTTGKELRTLAGHTGFINMVVIAPDGQTAISSSTDKTIKIWDLATGELVRTLTGHLSFVNPLALSADGQTLISGSSDKTIKVWNPGTGEAIYSLNPGIDVKHFVISPDWQTIASGSGGNTIKVWQLQK
ncbi:MAG: serine/threonine protein kinase [Drouetiella hepatica Uher 2000/2452]|jgi:WD40 repeat protein|uniref:Serine/threonine protein kinase n=1 Tax=Drouetiella hepatica Uher 2000/2452 TaxID=904376 RepID=A0A951UKL9_9CYAN|nr:serine/threonine protein kinase [Drouetiella hepatica Uher 2000/2452]